MAKPDFRYYLITDRKHCSGDSLSKRVEEACRQGIRAVQLREKDLSARELYELAKELRTVTARWDTRLLINSRVDIAMAVGADGVHCPESGLSPRDVRRLSSDLLVGVSVHSRGAAVRAGQDGADFLLFGPVYHTPSKAKYGSPQGIKQLKEVAAAVSIPVYAVGDITPARATGCLKAGAYGVAGISSVMKARSIKQTVNEWKTELKEL